MIATITTTTTTLTCTALQQHVLRFVFSKTKITVKRMGLHVGPYMDIEKSVISKNLSGGLEFVFNQVSCC